MTLMTTKKKLISIFYMNSWWSRSLKIFSLCCGYIHHTTKREKNRRKQKDKGHIHKCISQKVHYILVPLVGRQTWFSLRAWSSLWYWVRHAYPYQQSSLFDASDGKSCVETQNTHIKINTNDNWRALFKSNNWSQFIHHLVIPSNDYNVFLSMSI